MAWSNTLVSEFYLDGERGVVEGAASGNVVTLELAATATAKTIAYLVDRKWSAETCSVGRTALRRSPSARFPCEPARPNPWHITRARPAGETKFRKVHRASLSRQELVLQDHPKE